jgi:hypothetical protein
MEDMRAFAALLLSACGCSNTTSAPPPPAAVSTAKPAPERAAVEAPGFAVVELFTSEGCSSCPPAEAVLHAVGDESGVIALAFHVDYWNGSWADRFSSDAVTKRQRGYALALGSGLYTPEMVVNGTTQFVGSKRDVADARIEGALATPARTVLTLQATRDSQAKVTVAWKSAPPLPGTELVVALTERDLVVTPTSGELGGETLHHDHVVRAFSVSDGSSGAGVVHLAHPDSVRPAKSQLVAFLQESGQRTIVGATRIGSP